MSKDYIVQYIQKKGHEETDTELTISSRKCDVYVKSLLDNQNSNVSWRRNSLFWLKEIFLPQGYPHSVSPDYLQYQIWDSLQVSILA